MKQYHYMIVFLYYDNKNMNIREMHTTTEGKITKEKLNDLREQIKINFHAADDVIFLNVVCYNITDH